MPSKYPSVETLWSVWVGSRTAGDAQADELLADYWQRFRCNMNCAQVEHLAAELAASRPGDRDGSWEFHKLHAFIKDFPGEFLTVEAALERDSCGVIRSLWRGVVVSERHCQRLILAYLLGHHVSTDTHQLCHAVGLSSVHSPMSMPLVGPFPPSDDKDHLQRVARRVASAV